VVSHYLSASEICPDKRCGFRQEGPYNRRITIFYHLWKNNVERAEPTGNYTKKAINGE
jgi:hypothetical protein